MLRDPFLYMDFKLARFDDEGTTEGVVMANLIGGLLVLAFLVLPGLLAVLGRVADTRDPQWSVGALLGGTGSDDRAER